MMNDLDRLRQAVAEYRAADEAAAAVLLGDKYDHDKYEAAVTERAISARLLASAADWLLKPALVNPPRRYELVDEADAYVNERPEDAADNDDWDVEVWDAPLDQHGEPYPEEEDARWGYARD
jgi:hypothetical protein